MDISITYLHVDHDDEVKSNIESKLAKIDRKYKIEINGAKVILEKKKHLFQAEIILSAKNLKSVATGESDKNIYVAIDEAVDRIDTQLKRHKEKKKSHKTKESFKSQDFDEPDEENL